MKFWIAFVAASLAALGQPCLAADLTLDSGSPQRGGAFLGAAIRMPLGTKEPVKPTARLELSLERVSHRTSSEQLREQLPILELGGSSRKGARMYVAGQELGDAQRHLRLDGSTANILVGVGFVAVLVVAVLMARQAHAGP